MKYKFLLFFLPFVITCQKLPVDYTGIVTTKQFIPVKITTDNPERRLGAWYIHVTTKCLVFHECRTSIESEILVFNVPEEVFNNCNVGDVFIYEFYTCYDNKQEVLE